MGWVVNCECGESVRADSEDALVASVDSHVGAKHPDMIGTLTRADVLSMAHQN